MRVSWRGGLTLLALMLGGGAGQADAPDGGIKAYPIVASNQVATATEEAPRGTCKSESAEDSNETETAEQKRKRYIKCVLSRSTGKASTIDLRGKQLARAGSGFFVAADGALITNHRLVDGCSLISVSPTFGEMRAAVPIGADPEADLALLRADAVPPGIASFTDSHGVLSGEPLYVIGYPGPGTATAEPALTSVKILGSQKTVFSAPTIAIEGAILSGNNGGPLLDSSGGVIGVVLANATQTYAATGGRADAVGLVSPSETLQRFLQEHGVDGRAGLKIPPKSEDRLLIDARPFMVQVGCWW